MMKTHPMFPAVALGLLLGIPGLVKAEFAFTTIDVPGSTRTAVNGNSPPTIVGEFDDADKNTHGFVLNNGIFSQIDVPGAGLTTVNGINAPGQLAGIYLLDAKDPSTSHAFFLNKGIFTTLDPPGSIRSQAGFLNAKGQVVGTYRSDVNKRHGFIWSNGVFTTLNEPDADPVLGTVVFGINDLEQVVGDYVNRHDGKRHGFLLSKGVYTTFDPPGSVLTVAEGINNAGQIAGLYFRDFDNNGNPINEHGFVLSKDVFETIDVPDATATTVFSINAQGEIVGSYDDASGVTHGYVGTPVH